MVDVNDVLRRHASRIEGQIRTSPAQNINYSREYVKFKQETAPNLSRYEQWAKSLGSIIKLKVAKKDEERIKPVKLDTGLLGLGKNIENLFK